MRQVNYQDDRDDIDGTADGASAKPGSIRQQGGSTGGSEVRALRYQRASQDKKEQGKSVHDQGVLNVKEINSHGWADSASFTDNDRSASRHATKERDEFERLIEAIQRGKGDVLVIWEISRKPA